MRYDIRILWIDDSPLYYQETKDIVEMHTEDMGLSADIEYISDAEALVKRLKKEEDGFKKYDIFFVDYSLSREIVGSIIIKELRKINIDSDILFYSSEHESDIREIVMDDLGSFEGVYIANRNNFAEKSNYLIKKNAKRLTSLSNIRGVLTDQTSENDFIIVSYILTKFDNLRSDQKDEVSSIVLEYLNAKKVEFESNVSKELIKIQNSGVNNIKRLFDLPSYLFPIEVKYKVFEKMVEFNDEDAFRDNPIEEYLSEIVKMRNTIAHKKLDICRAQQYILYCNNVNQFIRHKCPEECNDHDDESKISISQWDNIRKSVIDYGKCFDVVLAKIMQDFPRSITNNKIQEKAL